MDLGFRVIEEGGGRAIVECTVDASNWNRNETLHGGAIATLVDEAGTLAIRSADREGRYGVTTDLNVSYFAAGVKGAVVRAEARALKVGKTLAFVEVDVRAAADGTLLAQGRMTKYMPVSAATSK